MYVIHRRDKLRAERVYSEPLMKAGNVEFLWNSTVCDILHDDRVTGIRVKNKNDGNEKEVLVNGVFISIGRSPQTKLFSGQIKLDS